MGQVRPTALSGVSCSVVGVSNNADATTREAFGARLDAAALERRSVLCVGLDPVAELLPEEVWRGVRAGRAGTARAFERFCVGILDAVAEHVVAVKPQLGFFEPLGQYGLSAFEAACERARELGLLVVVDAKRGDIGSTAAGYAAAYLGGEGAVEGAVTADVLTVNPYLGDDSLQPFLDACRRSGAGLFILVRTSNPGGADLQELELAGGGRVWEQVARLVDRLGQGFDPDASLSSIGAVIGATQSHVLHRARELMPRAPFLLPGVGAQGGEVDALSAAFAPGPGGGLVAASRSILYAGSADGWQAAAAAEAARLREQAWRLVEETGARV
jgi:orotidine-5'-phosphate decarboxylase